MKILLIHLGAYGDCIIATTLARQIKADYPGSHLTWAVAERFASAVDNNPDVDDIWKVDIKKDEPFLSVPWRNQFQKAIDLKFPKGSLDIIFDTMIHPNNRAHYDGTIRSATFNNYPNPITVPIDPVMRLYDAELEHVRAFAEKHELSKYQHVILFESTPGSNQSVLNLEIGLKMAQQIVDSQPDAIVIISTYLPVPSTHPRIIAANMLSFRENVALSHYCTFLIGGSSGLSWLLTSSSAKKLETVQFLTRQVSAGFASMVYDFSYFGLSSEHILESQEKETSAMAKIVLASLADFAGARSTYHETLRPYFWNWLYFVDWPHGIKGILLSYRTMFSFVRRNGLRLRDLFEIWPIWSAIRVAWRMFIVRT
jgi:ADP-heptose:LPS heptosyltransferase